MIRCRISRPLRLGVLAFFLLESLPSCSAPEAPPWPFDAAPGKFRPPERIVLLGDSRPRRFLEFWRSGAQEVRERIIDRIAVERPDLVLHLGDLVTDGSSAAWARFDREMASLREAGIPFFPALGNHELFGGGGDELRNYFSRFPGIGGRRWYDLRRGPLLILVLDSNWSRMSAKEGAAQDRWYRDELRASDEDASIRCVMVLSHHPAYTNASNHTPSKDVEERLVAPAKAYGKVRLFASGHVHSYERFERDGKVFLVSGGGGAPLAVLGRKDGSSRFPDRYDGGKSRPNNYLLLSLEEDRLAVHAMMMREDRTWHRADGVTIRF